MPMTQPPNYPPNPNPMYPPSTSINRPISPPTGGVLKKRNSGSGSGKDGTEKSGKKWFGTSRGNISTSNSTAAPKKEKKVNQRRASFDASGGSGSGGLKFMGTRRERERGGLILGDRSRSRDMDRSRDQIQSQMPTSPMSPSSLTPTPIGSPTFSTHKPLPPLQTQVSSQLNNSSSNENPNPNPNLSSRLSIDSRPTLVSPTQPLRDARDLRNQMIYKGVLRSDDDYFGFGYDYREGERDGDDYGEEGEESMAATTLANPRRMKESPFSRRRGVGSIVDYVGVGWIGVWEERKSGSVQWSCGA